ncbi:MAG: hypothetical protein ACM3JG_01090, partial [Thiohalocapsa sp.]
AAPLVANLAGRAIPIADRPLSTPVRKRNCPEKAPEKCSASREIFGLWDEFAATSATRCFGFGWTNSRTVYEKYASFDLRDAGWDRQLPHRMASYCSILSTTIHPLLYVSKYH